MPTTLEQLRIDGYKLIQCCCDHCGRMVMLPIADLPMRLRGLDMEQLTDRLKCKKCGTRTSVAEPLREGGPGIPERMW